MNYLANSVRLTLRRLSALTLTSMLLSLSFAQTASAQDTGSAAAEPKEQTSSEENLATARLHFANGVELLQASPPNYQDAFRQFQLAYEKSEHSWKVLGNLGLCALKLERDGEALSYYETYLAQGGNEIDPNERSHIERETLLIKGNMVHIQLTSPTAGFKVAVARQSSSAPTQIYETATKSIDLGLRAGTLKVTATRADGKSLSWEVTVSAEETRQHTFDFDKKETAPASGSSSTAAQPVEKKGLNGLQIGGIVVAGVGVGVLGGGIALGVMSGSTESQARDSCIDQVCAEDAESDFDKAKRQAMVANILFISGGLLAATGVTLIVVGSTSSSQKTSTFEQRGRVARSFALELAPHVQPGGGGVLAFGTF